MRPGGRGSLSTYVQENKEPKPQIPQAAGYPKPANRPPANPAHGRPTLASVGKRDYLAEFVKIWPRHDADEGKLRGAWINHVLKARVNPERVIQVAKGWRGYHLVHPEKAVPLAGMWLANEGWEWEPPPNGS
jgi:hypothetical protein